MNFIFPPPNPPTPLDFLDKIITRSIRFSGHQPSTYIFLAHTSSANFFPPVGEKACTRRSSADRKFKAGWWADAGRRFSVFPPPPPRPPPLLQALARPSLRARRSPAVHSRLFLAPPLLAALPINYTASASDTIPLGGVPFSPHPNP